MFVVQVSLKLTLSLPFLVQTNLPLFDGIRSVIGDVFGA